MSNETLGGNDEGEETSAQSRDENLSSTDAAVSKISAARRPTRTKRVALIALVSVLLLVYFAPTIFLWLRKGWAEAKLSEETGLQVRVDSLSAGWFSSIRVGDLSLSTNDGDQIALIKEVETEKSLLGLLMRDREVGGIRIQSPLVHVPLEGVMAEELRRAAERIDPRKGLLGKIVNPDRDAVLRLEIVDGKVEMRPTEFNDWKTVVESLNVAVDIDHTPELDHVQLKLEPTPIRLNADLADHALKFAAPVLAGAVDLDGLANLEIEELDLKPQQWQGMSARGTLVIEEANANIQAKLIDGIASVFGDGNQAEGQDVSKPDASGLDVTTSGSTASSTPEGPKLEEQVDTSGFDLQLARESRVAFEVKDQIVHHEGLEFAMRDILPNFRLTSSGDVGFDETLNFEVGLTLPIEKLGDGPLLQKIGTPSLTVPVQGTFDNPDVGIGEGKLIGGLISEVVDSLTDGNVDADPILKKIQQLEILNRRSSKTNADGSASATESDAANPSGENDAAIGGSDEPTAEPGLGRGRILDRLRKRFQGGSNESTGDGDQPTPSENGDATDVKTTNTGSATDS